MLGRKPSWSLVKFQYHFSVSIMLKKYLFSTKMQISHIKLDSSPFLLLLLSALPSQAISKESMEKKYFAFL